MTRYAFWLLWLLLMGGAALAQPISSENAVIPGGTGLTVGNPTGGAPGPGSINIQGQLLINGAPASGTGTVTSVTAGTGLGGGTITGIGTVYLLPTTVTPGSYTAANITVNAEGQITAASNGSSGGSVTWPTTGQIVVSNGTNTPASVPYGLTGASTIVETTSGGLLTASIIPAINLATGVTGLLPLGNIAQGGATTNQVLTWNGSAWAGATPSSGGNVSNVGTPTNGQIALWTGATTIQGASTLPLSDLAQGGATTNQVIQWNGSAWVPGTVSGGSGCATTGCTYTGLINTVGISDASTAGFVTTGRLQFVGAPTNGNGTVLDNETSYTEPTSGNALRVRYWFDTATFGSSSSVIDEGDFHGRLFTGSNGVTIATEINGIHSYLSDGAFVSGFTLNNSFENFEASTQYSNAHNSTNSFDALQAYTANGSATGVVSMFSAGLSNANPTTGSIQQYTVLACKPVSVSGGGSYPTNDECVLDQDPLGAIVDYANLTIGSTGAAGQATKLYVKGTAAATNPTVAATTNEVQVYNIAGTNIFNVGDNGQVTFGGAISAGSLGTGTQVSCLGLTSGNLIVPSTGACGSGSGGITSVTNSDGSLTITTTSGAVTASLNTGNANTYTVNQTFGYVNGSSATGFSGYGAVGQLTNQNVAASSVSNWANFECKALAGGGSTPVNNLCLRNDDATQVIATLGGLSIGVIGSPAGVFNSRGTNSAEYTYNSTWQNSAGTIVDTITNTGNLIVGQYALGSMTAQFTVQGPDTSTTPAVQFNNSTPLPMFQVLDNGTTLDGFTVSTPSGYAQVSGGSVSLPFKSTTGMSTGQIVSGVSIPFGDTISSIVSTAQVSFATTASSASGQAVISVTSSPAVAVGQQCVDSTHGGYIGAGNLIQSVSAGTSVTLTSNIVTTIPSGDTIICTPVVTLATATTAAISGVVPIGFYTTSHTALSTATTFVDFGDASFFGNVMTGGALTADTTSILASSTAPTIASGFGTSPTAPLSTESTAWFQLTVGSGGTANSGVVTMPTAAHGWSCNVVDGTSIGTIIVRSAPTSATSVTWTSYSATTGTATAFNASDILTANCTGG